MEGLPGQSGLGDNAWRRGGEWMPRARGWPGYRWCTFILRRESVAGTTSLRSDRANGGEPRRVFPGIEVLVEYATVEPNSRAKLVGARPIGGICLSARHHIKAVGRPLRHSGSGLMQGTGLCLTLLV